MSSSDNDLKVTWIPYVKRTEIKKYRFSKTAFNTEQIKSLGNVLLTPNCLSEVWCVHVCVDEGEIWTTVYSMCNLLH